MLEWKVCNQHTELLKSIETIKQDFDSWFDRYWSKSVSREEMLSKDSPLPRTYYLMCKTEDEILKEFPHEGKETCSSCDEMVDEWIETKFSFCDEYNCGMKLCKKCAKEFNKKINDFLEKE